MNANLSSFKVLAFVESFHFVRKNTFENHCTCILFSVGRFFSWIG